MLFGVRAQATFVLDTTVVRDNRTSLGHGIEDSRNSEEDSGASSDLTGSPSEPVISDGESEEL